MMQQQPLVTVICLCYNHEDYVIEAINSVINQSYSRVELIVVDDASTDDSQPKIKNYLADKSDIQCILLNKNVGNCAAFNVGLARAGGKYIIDLAADDVLMPNRIERQVHAFESLPNAYAVVFSDAWLIDEQGNSIRTYYSRNKDGQLQETVPSGHVYQQLIKKAFICSPTMMMRKAVLDELNGYDESLSYEDYDFWVRSGRKYAYHYQDELLTKKRILTNSHRKGFYKKSTNPHLESTLKVCWKAFAQNQTQAEHLALAVSVRYHMRQALYMEMFELVFRFAALLEKLDQLNWKDQLTIRFARQKIKLHRLYNYYLRLRNQ
ncbi:MAG: glycosyltransferase family 2 protein [Flammeovirgaceae bacterium]